MQPVIKVTGLFDAVLAVAKVQLRRGSAEVEFFSALKTQPALPDVLLIFRRVERNLHTRILSTLS
jgi:hypothetical protein